MSKAHRGKGIRDQAAHGRGDCPVCNRSNVKILYEQEAGEQKVKICKTCRAAIKHGKKSIINLAVASSASEGAAAERAAPPKAAAPAAETASAVAAETPAAEV
ncbi:hypothetical protein AGMMS50293_09210 [Spirochaetia bacterium]|nr:hypothetical protein AGMMS50293_09210 [Spirochaetia bacterium]